MKYLLTTLLFLGNLVSGCGIKVLETQGCSEYAPVVSLATHPNNNSFLTGSGNGNMSIKRWDLNTGNLIQILNDSCIGRGATAEVEITSSGSKIAVISSGGSVKVWDLKTGNLLHELYDSNASDISR